MSGALRGRVLAAIAGELTLLADGRIERVSGVVGRCRPGDLVLVRPTSGGAPVVDVVFRHPSGEFPTPGSDAMAFAGGRFAALHKRAAILDRTRAWFRDAGFLEVETPLLVASPGTEVHLDPVGATLTPRPGAEPEPRWLITSPELHMKRLLVAGAPPIFQLARVFRDGERGHRHRPEFTMLEWYRPWASYDALMNDCEGWLRALAGADHLAYRGQTLDLTPPWPRVRFYDALRERAGLVEPERLDPDQQLVAFVDRVEQTLGAERPEFLIEWPIAMASLARPAPHDPRVAERFELFIAGLELANAFGELTDAAEQRRRCEAENAERQTQGRPEFPLDEAFLAALAEGMPPSAGIAVGMDRVVMLLTDAAAIDDVLAF